MHKRHTTRLSRRSTCAGIAAATLLLHCANALSQMASGSPNGATAQKIFEGLKADDKRALVQISRDWQDADRPGRQKATQNLKRICSGCEIFPTDDPSKVLITTGVIKSAKPQVTDSVVPPSPGDIVVTTTPKVPSPAGGNSVSVEPVRGEGIRTPEPCPTGQHRVGNECKK